jgi:hypothetical protein
LSEFFEFFEKINFDKWTPSTGNMPEIAFTTLHRPKIVVRTESPIGERGNLRGRHAAHGAICRIFFWYRQSSVDCLWEGQLSKKGQMAEGPGNLREGNWRGAIGCMTERLPPPPRSNLPTRWRQ